MNVLNLIGRKKELFQEDINIHNIILMEKIEKSSFLVVGGAGSIGQAVVKEIFSRNPKKIHVVDISENNLVELVRDIRSSFGYIDGDFRTFAIDVGSIEFDVFFNAEGPYDYVLNLSALKHVRSEKDPYTLMRMVDVNILNTIKTVEMAAEKNAKKYFCVSTDKAANPVNMMGASKRIMEMCILRNNSMIPISTARFANVAFSDGSLLYGFNRRIEKMQPISAPRDVRRYFVTPQESGQLCLMSALLGKHMEIFFPKLDGELHLVSFSEIAEKYLSARGLEPYLCSSEDEARSKVKELYKKNKWPCYFFDSDTTGEKPFEEFFTTSENVNFTKYIALGVISEIEYGDSKVLNSFIEEIQQMKTRGWSRYELIQLFNKTIPNFDHIEKGKFLDGRM
ncbi:MAG: UDP-N-acetylglucosamine 4,6-dehydratase [Spirochaetes bacterium]|nr:UDP-N-acetylglucosamine 4,6-dehydratase [Syntrophaceae bacterium]MBN2771541.1 UDP-N-acetylglucosamine 4,6-dehydratase [Spirochaetota bacterium]